MDRVTHEPTGKLKGPLGDLWSYRVGDVRLTCDLEDEIFRVLVLPIAHRSEVYR